MNPPAFVSSLPSRKTRRMHLKNLLVVVIPILIGCGDDAAHDGHVTTDAGVADVGPTDSGVATDQPLAVDVPATDQDAASDAGVAADAPVAVPVLNDCAAPTYVDRTADAAERTVVPRGTTGYTPRCLTVRAGKSVTFAMSFTTHPLNPGVPHGSSAGATSPSPIEAQRAGDSYTVAFTGAGFYPFYCNIHGHVGMAGTVRVVP